MNDLPRQFGLRHFALIALLSLASAGCVHRHVERSECGHPIDGKAFARIVPGKTSADWARSLVGPPTQIKKTDTGSEIWKWSYEKTTRVDGQLLILTDKSSTTYHREAMVEVRDGMVVNKWFDERDIEKDKKTELF